MRDQTIRVGAVEPESRLVQDVQRVSALRTLQLGRELDTLRFTPGKRLIPIGGVGVGV